MPQAPSFGLLFPTLFVLTSAYGRRFSIVKSMLQQPITILMRGAGRPPLNNRTLHFHSIIPPQTSTILPSDSTTSAMILREIIIQKHKLSYSLNFQTPTPQTQPTRRFVAVTFRNTKHSPSRIHTIAGIRTQSIATVPANQTIVIPISVGSILQFGNLAYHIWEPRVLETTPPTYHPISIQSIPPNAIQWPGICHVYQSLHNNVFRYLTTLTNCRSDSFFAYDGMRLFLAWPLPMQKHSLRSPNRRDTNHVWYIPSKNHIDSHIL